MVTTISQQVTKTSLFLLPFVNTLFISHGNVNRRD